MQGLQGSSGSLFSFSNLDPSLASLEKKIALFKMLFPALSVSKNVKAANKTLNVTMQWKIQQVNTQLKLYN